MNRYSNINFILDIGYGEGVKIINKAYEKVMEEKLWERWLVDYARMDKDNFTNFEDYKNKLLGPRKTSKRTAEEILKEAHEIRGKIKGSATTSKT